MKKFLHFSKESESDASSSTTSDEEFDDETKKSKTPSFVFKCDPQQRSEDKKNEVSMDVESDLFIFDVNGAENVHSELASGTNSCSDLTAGKKSTDHGIFEGFSPNDPHLKKLLAKAKLQANYDQLPPEDVVSKSRRQLKKLRKVEREKTTGVRWHSMPATELTDERRRDLELIQMRDAIDLKTHYRKPERDVLPKYFQVGRIIETKADFYSSRMTKKERKQTLVDELMDDHEIIARNRSRYNKMMAKMMKSKRGAFQRKGPLPKHSKRKKRMTKRN